MNPKLKVILKIVSNTLVAAVVVLAVLLHGVRLFGLKPYSVLSGSMESVYPTGSLIYVKKVDPSSLKKGDIITFRMASGTVATHRIIEILPDESDPDALRFRTKGDENDVADGTPVDADSVIGRAVFCLPLLGYLATYMMQPPGKYVAIAAAIVILFVEMMLSVLLDNKDTKKSEKQKK